MKANLAAGIFAAALLLTACGAQPANLPTVTPVANAPKPSNDATPALSTPTPANTTGAASQSSGSDRPFAKFTAAQRGSLAKAPPPMTIDVTKKYIATIVTSKGEIKVQLDPSAAPATVNNFVYLSENGFYDGLTFHRVVPNFVIQGGDPAGNGSGGPGYTLPPEIKLLHVDGAIAMARQSGPPESTPSSGSQFYITIGAQAQLDQQYTVFGNTLSGLDVVRKIAVGDVIQRIDISLSDAASAAAAPATAAAVAAVTPTTAPPATCSAFVLNLVKDDHIRGNAQAPLTMIEYGDFQCPVCAQTYPTIKGMFALVSDTMKLVFRHLPIPSIHDKAQITSQAVEAAGLQSKFWEMHDLLYEKQSEWSTIPVTDVTSKLKTYAVSLGMDGDKFAKDLVSPEVIARVDRDAKTGEVLQIPGTPWIFLNDRPINASAFTPDNISVIADQLRLMATQRQQLLASITGPQVNVDKPDQVVETGATYNMSIKTSKGEIQVELDPKLAPVNVNSVIYLSQKGYYANAPIEQNVADPGLVLFGDASRLGNPGYVCGFEASTTGAFDKPGVVGLLTTDGLNNNSQIFITYSPTQQLETHFSVIGHVTAGLDIAKSLQASQGVSDTTVTDKIVSVTISKK